MTVTWKTSWGKWLGRLIGSLALLSGVLLEILAVGISPTSASTAGTGTGVSYVLEGCRGSTSSYLPGTFTCPDSAYTTGNLGKGWNEFDLVPGRITLTASSNHPVGESFTFAIAVDARKSANLGYDQLTSPSLNARLSSAGAAPGLTVSAPMSATPGMGGTDVSLYRLVTVSGMRPGTTYVLDFVARLALGSHLYPGSSLHFDLTNSQLKAAGMGARDVSVNVGAAVAPTVSKTQTSTTGSGNLWTLTKTSTPATFTFPDTCSASGRLPQPVTVTLAWTKTAVASDQDHVVAYVSLQNNARRPIEVTVSDQLYSGSTPAAGNEIGSPITTSGGPIVLSAGGLYTYPEVWTTAAGPSSFSDVATATFTDPVFGTVLTTATATASSTVQVLDPASGDTATITDTEVMTGSADFSFSAAAPTLGSFAGYSPGTSTTGPVTWNSPVLTASGSVVFDKTVTVSTPTTGQATLSDTATLTPDGAAVVTAQAASVFTGAANSSLVIHKTLTAAQQQATTFAFSALGTDGSSGSTTIVVPAGSVGPVTGVITGLTPGVRYTVSEAAVTPFPARTFNNVIVNLPDCSTALAVTNTPTPRTAPGTGTTTTTRLNTTATTQAHGGLAFTGSSSGFLAASGAVLVVFGGIILWAVRRPTDVPGAE